MNAAVGVRWTGCIGVDWLSTLTGVEGGMTARTDGPRVSVCIPVYQGESYIAETLDSVLAQEFDDMEVVVLDNCSTDATSAILGKYNDARLRIARNSATVPMPDNFNRAVRLCRGEFVKLVCADDLIASDCVSAQAAILADRPEVALVSCRLDFIDDNGSLLRASRGLAGLLGEHSKDSVVRTIVRSGGNPIGPPVATMFRKVDFDMCNGFDGRLLFPMELDMWTRLLEHGSFYGHGDTLCSFRVSSANMTSATSIRSQYSQHAEFVRGIRWDPSVRRRDRFAGLVNSFVMQAKRTRLAASSKTRARKKSR